MLDSRSVLFEIFESTEFGGNLDRKFRLRIIATADKTYFGMLELPEKHMVETRIAPLYLQNLENRNRKILFEPKFVLNSRTEKHWWQQRL